MFRQANPVLEIPDARMVTIRGQNLHEYTYVRLDWPGGTFNPSLRRVSESELTFYPPQEVFQNGNNTLDRAPARRRDSPGVGLARVLRLPQTQTSFARPGRL